jgi:hypothetical protein
MQPKKKAWTPEDEGTVLKAMVGKGYSPARASVALGRKLAAVRNHARKIGTPFPTMHQTRRRLNQVIEQRAEPR